MFKYSLALVLSITSIILISATAAAVPYGAGKYSANVPYGSETALSISTSGSVGVNITSTSPVQTLSTVTVSTSDVNGYKLYFRPLPSTNMVNQRGNIIPTSTLTTPGAIDLNTWGYNTVSGSNAMGAVAGDNLIRTTTQAVTSEATQMYYHVRADNRTAPGTYSMTVLYTAVPQTN